MFSLNKRKIPVVRYKHSMTKNSLVGWRFQDFAFNGLNPGYEIPLRKELFGLRTIVGLTMEEIYDMPIQERRYYTLLHNEKVEEEKMAMKGQGSLSDMDGVKAMTMQANERRSSK